MNIEVEKLFNLLNNDLYLTAPVLSGNTRNSIHVSKIDEDSFQIIIDPKFYDLNEWVKKGKPWKRVDGKLIGDIRIIKSKYPDIKSYAMWCNDLGAFGGKSTRSKHWVNRCVYEVCQTIANEIGAEVVNQLPL